MLETRQLPEGLFVPSVAQGAQEATVEHLGILSHLHLLLEIDTGAVLPKFMQLVLQGYARWYGTRQGYSGHVWQGRYKSPLVARDSYFLEAGRYIERNPLRAKLVTDPKDYPWSSYPVYAYGADNPLVDADPFYGPLGSTPDERQAAYRNFVQLESPYATMLDAELIESPFEPTLFRTAPVFPGFPVLLL